MIALIRILFPDYCIGCGKYGSLLCSPCAWKLPSTHDILPQDIYALLSYRNPTTQNLLKIMKSRRLPEVADLLGQRLAHDTIELFSEYYHSKNFHSPIIIPIPQTASRQAQRGYNHAELLADAFHRHCSMDQAYVATNILIKTKVTHKQALVKNRKERFFNISSSFSIAPGADIKNSCIIVIDDITTTGATMAAAREQLFNAGAHVVVCLAVAH